MSVLNMCLLLFVYVVVVSLIMISDWRSASFFNSQLRGPRGGEGGEEDEDVEVRKTESDGWNNCRTHVTSGERGRTD